MMNENIEQPENKEEKKKNPKRVAAGKRGAEVRTRNAELRKKELEKMKIENLKIKQITKDSETDEPKEICLPPCPEHSINLLDYGFVLFPIGIVGLGWYIYYKNKKPEKTMECKKESKKEKKEIDPFEFN